MDRSINVVILCHRYPPLSGLGGQRMQYLSKYLTEAGCNVTVITTKKGLADGVMDEDVPSGLLALDVNFLGRASVIQKPIGPFRAGPNTSTLRETLLRGALGVIKRAVFALFGQIPDPRLGFVLGVCSPWLAKSVKQALSDADVVIATTPPYPPLLAAILRRSRKAKLILDYRDNFSYCHDMGGWWLAKKAELLLDRWMVRQADLVVCVSEPMRTYYRRIGAPNTATITNGYDTAKIAEALKRSVPRNSAGPITVRYLGTIYRGRHPETLFTALSLLKRSGEFFPNRMRIQFIGNTDWLQRYVDNAFPDLQPYFEFHKQVRHQEALILMREADYVLFSERKSRVRKGHELSAEGIYTSKVFEYAAIGRPILADVDPDTMVGKFLREATSHHLVSIDAEEWAQKLRQIFHSGRPEDIEVSDFALRFSREAAGAQYFDLIRDLVVQS
jgi:hypothetical protein